MAKLYNDEIKQRAKDYVQIHAYTFEKTSEAVNVPLKTINGWSNRDPQGKWLKGKYKDKIDDIAEEMRNQMHDHPIWQTVKEKMLAEVLTESKNQTMLSVEEKVIANNRAEALIMEAMSIENFDLMALQGVQLANKKLMVMNLETDMRKVSMGEIKTYNEIVEKVKNQIHGKAPDTIIQIANQNNMNNQLDYSKLSSDELMLEFQKIEQKENLAKVSDNSIV